MSTTLPILCFTVNETKPQFLVNLKKARCIRIPRAGRDFSCLHSPSLRTWSTSLREDVGPLSFLHFIRNHWHWDPFSPGSCIIILSCAGKEKMINECSSKDSSWLFSYLLCISVKYSVLRAPLYSQGEKMLLWLNRF